MAADPQAGLGPTVYLPADLHLLPLIATQTEGQFEVRGS